MTKIQILKTLPSYLDYYLKVTDEHSLQSPFMFKFYNDLVRAIKENEHQSDLEGLRQQLQSADSIVSGVDFGAGSRVSSILISSIAKHGISTEKECRMLYALAQVTGAKNIIELGTSVGLATSYLSRANAKAKVVTFEGNDTLAKIATGLFQQTFCDNIELIEGNIDETFPDFLNTTDGVDMGVIDANHTGEALIRYYSLLKEKMNEKGIMVIDDIRWSADMYRAWKELISYPEVTISIDFLQCGIIFFKWNLQKQHYILSY